MTEDDMVGWHDRFYGHEFEQAPGVGDGRVTTGISAFPLRWPWEAQSSPRVARESWGWRSSHCRAEETSPKRAPLPKKDLESPS